MITSEPQCVQLKRDGAQRLMRKLEGKTPKEELVFWMERTKAFEKRLKDKSTVVVCRS